MGAHGCATGWRTSATTAPPLAGRGLTSDALRTLTRLVSCVQAAPRGSS